MAFSTPAEFLQKAVAAATAAGHVFPEHAACEAALESSWGNSKLAIQANNLFGQKQAHPPRGASLMLATREVLRGEWSTVVAQWMMFDDWTACFAERMRLLRSLQTLYPNYEAALAAGSGEQFVNDVSKSWSTDPERASKVLSVYREHFAASEPAVRIA